MNKSFELVFFSSVLGMYLGISLFVFMIPFGSSFSLVFIGFVLPLLSWKRKIQFAFINFILASKVFLRDISILNMYYPKWEFVFISRNIMFLIYLVYMFFYINSYSFLIAHVCRRLKIYKRIGVLNG